MSARRPGTLAATATYYATHALLVAAGLVSMPIVTRLVTPEQYGLLSLVLASTTLFGALGRLGFPNATTRFFAEERKRGAVSLRRFCESMLTGALAGGVTVAVVAFAGSAWLGGDTPESASLWRLASLLIVVRVVGSVIFEIFRADEDAWVYSVSQVLLRYSTLGLGVVLLLGFERTARAVILATTAAEGAVTVWFALLLVRRGIVRRLRWSWPDFVNATHYGLPLTVVGAGSLMLQYGDRFLIERFIGLSGVALYAVPYDLAANLSSATLQPLQLVALPVVFRLWATEGGERASQFLSTVANGGMAAMIPVAAAFLFFNDEIVSLFASSKYASSSSLTPYILPGLIVDQLTFTVACGLRLHQRTGTAAAITLAGAALNILLNLVLLPFLGLRGAALATTASYAAIFIGTAWYARSAVQLHIDFGLLARSSLATLCATALVVFLGPLPAGALVDLLVRGGIFVASAFVCLAALERELRSRLVFVLRRVLAARQKLGEA